MTLSAIHELDGQRLLLAGELLAIFVLGPLVVWKGWWPARLKMILLGLVAIVTAGTAWAYHAPAEALGIGDSARTMAALEVGIGLWLVAQATAAVIHLRSGRAVFPFVREQPRVFAMICIVYTGSVIAQEFLFRSYFFWRYGPLGTVGLVFAINVLIFGWIHIVFNSWISVMLTWVGGLFFAGLYLKYHSLAGVCVAHLLCGLSIFAMGYGRYFYGGSDALAERLRLPKRRPELVPVPVES